MIKSEIKFVKSLHLKKRRVVENRYVIEGVRVVKEAIKAQQKLMNVYFTHEFSTAYQTFVSELRIITENIQEISSKEMHIISTTETPPGIVAVCQIPTFSKIPTENNWLFLDSVSDPGNVGTLVRTALWFGIKHIAFSENSADLYSPKVVRSSMGAHFYLECAGQIPLDKFVQTHTIIGAGMNGENFSYTNVAEPWILVLGNEAHGLSAKSNLLVHKFLTIPQIGFGDSLNVAIAGGILLNRLTATKSPLAEGF